MQFTSIVTFFSICSGILAKPTANSFCPKRSIIDLDLDVSLRTLGLLNVELQLDGLIKGDIEVSVFSQSKNQHKSVALVNADVVVDGLLDVDVDLSPPSQAQVRIIFLDRTHYRKENNDDIMMSEDFLLKLMDQADSGSNRNNVVQQQGDTADTATEGGHQAASQENSIGLDKSGPVRLFKDEGQEIVALNVDLRQSVRKFKSNLASLFGLDGHSLLLYYIDHEMVGLMGPELLKHNQKKLWNYNVQDGDQFIVEEL